MKHKVVYVINPKQMDEINNLLNEGWTVLKFKGSIRRGFVFVLQKSAE